MTTEVEWRRKWKPGLEASPWQPISVTPLNDGSYLLKRYFTQDSYKVLITDYTSFWYEHLEAAEIRKRVKTLNPGLEASLSRILDQIQSAVEKAQEGGEESLTVDISVKDETETETKKLIMSVKSSIAGIPFKWNFICNPAKDKMRSKHLTVPLMTMVAELTRRQKELIKLLQNKDKEIEDYKSQGVKPSRKHIETLPFVQTAFEMNMMTSKGFENQAKEAGLSTFNSDGQDLYRQIMTKRAWLTRSPGKDKQPGDSVADDDDDPDLAPSINTSQSGSRKRSIAQSWGTARLPASLVADKSPEKSSSSPHRSSSTSPSSKSPRTDKSTSPSVSPSKDPELLRRQELERRLEREEQKKQEKAKKKKKIPF